MASLRGVGPVVADRLARLLDRAEPSLLDLLAHLPRAVLDPRPRRSLGQEDEGQRVTVEVEIMGHRPRSSAKAPYRVLARGAGAKIEITLFGPKAEHIAARYLFESRYRLSGTLRRHGDRWQLIHPEPIGDHMTALVPIYPSSAGLTQRTLRAAMTGALERLAPLPEWADLRLVAREGWIGFPAALAACHGPRSAEDLEPQAPARRRLAYDELLASQLSVQLLRRRRGARPGRSLIAAGGLPQRLRAALPFALTGAQEAAIAEITADLARPAATTRLLQGDVGSGKTLVALAAMLHAVEAGAQAALLAPTEVLARQHHATIAGLVVALGLQVELVIGRDGAAARRRALSRLGGGEVRLAVGTHALLEDRVAFADLGLVVIDEQHRFGVGQRLALTRRGPGVDLLLTTATPIPRTAILAAYGDLAVSSLRERPAGRQPIATSVISASRVDALIAGLTTMIDAGERVFWVCPLIEESERSGDAAAVARHSALARSFGPRVGLIHGRMRGAEKERALMDFRDGRTPLLVATTVIEVGVDVPEAGVMVIEEAQRFGLAQLHQLRGRVGRGGRGGHAILLHTPPLGQAARARLALMRGCDDGFTLAEKDLELRGPGDILGTRQSGLPSFRFADLAAHGDLLEIARKDAAVALDRDPRLTGSRGPVLRLLLDLLARETGAGGTWAAG